MQAIDCIYCIYTYEVNSGMIFPEREFDHGPPKRQAGQIGESAPGETFRQKDWEKDCILNLVLK